MWYITKVSAPASLCYNIFLFLILQVNCQFPNLFPPIPNLLPPIPNIVPPIPNLLPPIPNIIPPIPNLLPPIPNILPPIPNLPSIPGLMSPPSGTETCPRDTTKMKVECADVLGIPVIPVGAVLNPLKTPCCKFIEGLVDVEAAVCVCRALTFNNTNPKIDIPVSVVLLLNYCNKDRPPGFVCASS